MAKDYFREYLKYRPIHVAMLRARECEFYAPLKLERPILDIGAGDGFFALVAFDEPIDVGIDNSEKYFAEAKKSGCYKRLEIANATALPYPNGYFGSVVSNCTFEHIPEVEKALREAYRVLKKNGTLVCTMITDKFDEWSLGVSVLRKLRLGFLARIYIRYLRTFHFHYHTYPPLIWQEKLERAGFKIIHRECYFPRKAMYLFDFFHWPGYLTFFSKILFGRWILFPGKIRFLRLDRWLRPYIQRGLKEGVGVFFVAKKI